MMLCAWLLHVVACIQLMSVPIECARKLFNIDFLGIGYDAIQGNPQNDVIDPGFKNTIFLLEYTENIVTADGRFLLPDNTDAQQLMSCNFKTDTEEVYDEESYQDSLLVGRPIILSYFVVQL